MKLDVLKFKKGEFITQNNSPESFAIFGGDIYEPSEGETETLYSLICYYNPTHYERNSEGKWVKESILEYDFGDTDVCEYTISSDDFDYWRSCTKREIESALKMLAETKHLAWEEKTNKFRKLGPNEHIVFDEPKSTGACNGNVNRSSGVNPFYQKQKTVKLITRTVKDDWEQKEPICAMNDEKRAFVAELCEKNRFYSTTSYNIGTTRVYPNCGAQVPRRMGFGQCAWDDAMGYGMCAYNALMNGEMWGAYDDYD